jgi:hypothetical protein
MIKKSVTIVIIMLVQMQASQAGALNNDQCQIIRESMKNNVATIGKFQEATLELGRKKIVADAELQAQSQFGTDAGKIYDDMLLSASGFWNPKLQEQAISVIKEVCD